MKCPLIMIASALCSVNAFAQYAMPDSITIPVQQVAHSIIGREYKLFDTTAFCSYSSFHPSQYLTDNNWDILCAFTESGKKTRLDSLGISYNESQLRLLEVGELLRGENGVYTTLMPIFGKEETRRIRHDSKAFADSILPLVEPDIRQLISEFNQAGYSRQIYSLVFSYLLDDYIWDEDKLSSPLSCDDHGTWSGAFWAMYESRKHDKIGTNGYGLVKQNWTDNLGYWMSSDKMIAFAKEVAKTNGDKIEDRQIIDAVAGWGMTDESGNILIPVLHRNNNDSIDILCQKITRMLSDSVKEYCKNWYLKYNIASEKLARIIFYHEVMWDILDILESRGYIVMPAILKGEETGRQAFGEICFIVI